MKTKKVTITVLVTDTLTEFVLDSMDGKHLRLAAVERSMGSPVETVATFRSIRAPQEAADDAAR